MFFVSKNIFEHVNVNERPGLTANLNPGFYPYYSTPNPSVKGLINVRE
jgi:plastocyanin